MLHLVAEKCLCWARHERSRDRERTGVEARRRGGIGNSRPAFALRFFLLLLICSCDFFTLSPSFPNHANFPFRRPAEDQQRHEAAASADFVRGPAGQAFGNQRRGGPSCRRVASFCRSVTDDYGDDTANADDASRPSPRPDRALDARVGPPGSDDLRFGARDATGGGSGLLRAARASSFLPSLSAASQALAPSANGDPPPPHRGPGLRGEALPRSRALGWFGEEEGRRRRRARGQRRRRG